MNKNNGIGRLDGHKRSQIELAKTYDEDIVINLPFAWNWANRYTASLPFAFAFTVAVTALNCSVGDLILDFACGSGWVSEWLRRLGYRTVSVDISTTLLNFAKKRMACDSRINDDYFPAYFVAGDVERLPFKDETFDGIICMNSLHHMPDYQVIFDEMYRVLKKDGRAAFSEPGCKHSQSPDSIREMQESGVLERDVVLSDIYDKALKAGFEELYLKPMLLPAEIDLTYFEWQRFFNGMPAIVEEYIQKVRTYTEDCHLFITLHKSLKKRQRDSRNPGLLRAAIEITDIPSAIKQGGDMVIKVLVKNTGDTLWLSEMQKFGGHVTLGVKLLVQNGKILNSDFGRALLPKDVMPGESVEVVMQLGAPSEKGEYVLKFDMVCERITWFEGAGSMPLSVRFEVTWLQR